MSDVTTPGSTDPLTLYTTTWCPFCVRLKMLLDEKGIGYVEIDVESDAAAAAFVESVNNGNRVVPTALYRTGPPPPTRLPSKVRRKLRHCGA